MEIGKYYRSERHAIILRYVHPYEDNKAAYILPHSLCHGVAPFASFDGDTLVECTKEEWDTVVTSYSNRVYQFLMEPHGNGYEI